MYETNDVKMYAALRCDDADRKAVAPILNALRDEGIAADYAEGLTNANTAAAIVFFSKASIASGSAKRHYGSAKKGGALLVPVVLDQSDPHEVPELSRLLGRKQVLYAKDLSKEALIRKIVYLLPTSVKYNKPEEGEEEEKEIPTGVAVGTCPLCGSDVRKGEEAFACESEDCSYALPFQCPVTDSVDPESILTKKILLDTVAAQTLLSGKTVVENIKSEEGKVFKAKLALDGDRKDSLVIVADKRSFSPFGFKKRR